MVLANFIGASMIPPSIWNIIDLHENMKEGDKLHSIIIAKNVEVNAESIAIDGYIETKHFKVIRKNIKMFQQHFEIDYPENGFYGILNDNIHTRDASGMNLNEAIQEIFKSHNCAMFRAGDLCLGIIKQQIDKAGRNVCKLIYLIKSIYLL